MTARNTRIPISPEIALVKWFPGRPGFRDRQREALERVWEGHSSVVLMPTGTGKSLVYQLPVLATNGLGIVISPLVALMEQQTEILRKLGATVLSLGGADAREAQESLRRFEWSKGPAFVFISPERLEGDGYLEFLLRKHRKSVTLVAVDEAHCISQWGHDFRPPYKTIPGFLDRTFGRDGWPPVLCLTATIDQHSLNEIMSDFRLKQDDVLRSADVLRTNLNLSFRIFPDSDTKLKALEEILAAHRGEKIIVYNHLKKNKTRGTRALADRFRGLGYRCAPFDADITIEEKQATLSGFVGDGIDLVFATGAFGMGIDIPNIRGVVHFLLPESLEQYYQEVGRAGRDGKPAFGVLLFTAVNAKVRRDMIRQTLREADQVREVWNQVCNVGRSELRTISPWTEFQGKDDEYALFHAFQRLGVLTVVARGPGRLHCFEARGPEGAALLKRLGSATRIGNTAAAIRSLGIDPTATIDQLFDLYDRNELKLSRSPDKTLLFKVRELQDDDVQRIVDDTAQKVEKRLCDFEAFVEVIQSGVGPADVLRTRFGKS